MQMLRLRRAACVAAAAALAACTDIPTHSAEADGTGPLASTYASVPTDMGCCGSFQDVNNAGLLVGIRDVGNNSRGAAYTPAMGYRFLPGLDSVYVYPVARAYGVNEAGVIVGQARDRYWVDRPVLWQSMTSVPIDLGALTEGGTGVALDVNAGGLVVGEAVNASNTYHAFVWTQAGGMVDIGPAAGGSSAQAVNDSGKVAGWMQSDSGYTRGFVWTQAGGRRALRPLGGTFSMAFGINNRGVVVGTASAVTGHQRAAMWTADGTPVDLGTLGGYLRAFTIHNAIPAPRVVAVSSTSIAKGGTFVAGGTFTDAGALDSPWKFRYFWGDGTYTAGTVNARGSIPTMSHVYAAAGSYSVSLWITDKDGRTGQSAPITVNVAP